MTRFRLIYGFLFISTFAFSQTDSKIGYIITNNNDTIKGYLQNHDYFKIKKIKISSNNLTNTYPKSSIKEIQIGDISGKIGHIDHLRSFSRDHAFPAAKDHPKLTSFFASFSS